MSIDPLSPERIQALRAKVKNVVDQIDPMGLLSLGAPDDEYECEVDDIFEEYLRIGPDPEALTRTVQTVFDRWFSPGSVPPARSRLIASRLCDAWASTETRET